MQARPYAQMIVNVLESLVRRTDLYNPETGDVIHPLLIEREEKSVLLIVIAGDKGFAGGFNSNIGKAAQKFIDARVAKGQNVDLEPVAKKAIGLYKRKYAAASYEKTEEHYDNDLSVHYDSIRHRANQVEVVSEHADLLLRSSFEDVTAMARDIIKRYERAEIDAVYIVYNEFKSVLSQRIVVEKLLPIKKVGKQEIESTEEMTQEQRDAAVIRRPNPEASAFTSRTPPRWIARRRSSVRRMWTTSLISRPKSFSRTSSRAMSPRRSFTRCLNQPQPNTQPA